MLSLTPAARMLGCIGSMATEGSYTLLWLKTCLLLPKSIWVSVDTAPTGMAWVSSATAPIRPRTRDLERTITRDMDRASIWRRHHRVGSKALPGPGHRHRSDDRWGCVDGAAGSP